MKTIARESIDRRWKRKICKFCDKKMRAVYIRQHYYDYKDNNKKKSRWLRIGNLCLKCRIVDLDNSIIGSL